MDWTSQNPKNKMHLAWKLVFTHLHMPDALIIYIHDISMILQKTGRRAWQRGHPFCGNMRETEIKMASLASLCDKVYLWFYRNCLGVLIQTGSSEVGHSKQQINKGKKTHIRTKAEYVLVKSFFFSYQLTMHHWLTSLKKKKIIRSSHQPWF